MGAGTDPDIVLVAPIGEVVTALGPRPRVVGYFVGRQPSRGEPFSQEAILNPSGFTGVDGLFRFTPNGLVQRGLAVLEVEPQGPIVIDPAPQSFQDVGF